jgi:hypothetical protein
MATPEIAYLLEIIRDAEAKLPGFCALAHTRRITDAASASGRYH